MEEYLTLNLIYHLSIIRKQKVTEGEFLEIHLLYLRILKVSWNSENKFFCRFLYIFYCPNYYSQYKLKISSWILISSYFISLSEPNQTTRQERSVLDASKWVDNDFYPRPSSGHHHKGHNHHNHIFNNEILDKSSRKKYENLGEPYPLPLDDTSAYALLTNELPDFTNIDDSDDDNDIDSFDDISDDYKTIQNSQHSNKKDKVCSRTLIH